MQTNPFIGVFYHWLGGLASGSFYVPYKGVKRWSWETYWLTGGIFSWIICPWGLAYIMTNDLFGVLRQQSFETLAWTYFFGVLWGLGGLTYGLTMRYLGLSLGTGVALGFCAAFGALVPPIVKAMFPNFFVFAGSTSIVDLVEHTSGLVVLAGVAICFAGIAIAALAGYTKESQMPAEQKQKAIKEFNFQKGILVAIFCGILSACFAYGLQAGKSINAASLAAGTKELWTGLPTLPVLLLGGFTTNFIWCLLLNIKNGTGYQYFASHVKPEHAHHGGTGSEQAPVESVAAGRESSSAYATVGGQAAVETVAANPRPLDLKIPWLTNFICCAVAGTTWYLQFFFYTMGATQMKPYDFASWTLHMSSIIIFATMWGWIFHEWKGSGAKAHRLITAGVATLVLSTVVIGLGTAMVSGRSFHDMMKLLFGHSQ
ncbi:MAG TPA: L-rhamnose/proton symporter RhaT [Candidatus Sulfotelmatobacter sp.]|nr:L-rhamnose/proton symporter RhaT [Candidatus Sulfotelmatobacter sp.]